MLRCPPNFFKYIEHTHKNFKKLVGATHGFLVIACELLVPKSMHADSKKSVRVEVAPIFFLKFLLVRSIDWSNFRGKRSTFEIFFNYHGKEQRESILETVKMANRKQSETQKSQNKKYHLVCASILKFFVGISTQKHFDVAQLFASIKFNFT